LHSLVKPAVVHSEFGHAVPVYFLDTAITENAAADQSLTDHLYRGDEHYRLCQEVVLGLGGVAMLRALGHQGVQAYHMNEGHSVLVPLALLEEQTWGRGLHAVTSAEKEAVCQRCVFTTHTPVLAGHDNFSLDLVREVLGDERTDFLITTKCCTNGVLSMASLALEFSRYVNGVSMRQYNAGPCKVLITKWLHRVANASALRASYDDDAQYEMSRC